MNKENKEFWLGDVMPIGGYYGPIASYYDEEFGYTAENFLQDKYFQMIADCGINLIVSADSDYATEPQDIKKTLELCEKYQLRFFLRDSRIAAEMTEQEMKECISAYRDSKAFAGIRVVDEPSVDYFPRNGEGRKLLEDHHLREFKGTALKLKDYDDLLGYVNLLPIYYWMSNTAEEYRDYVEECCEECQLKVISYDNYPFDFDDREKAFVWYFMNLSVVRGVAKQRSIPFWAFIQCGGQWNDKKRRFESRTYYPSEGEFMWNVNTSLAMGAKGIQYFPLTQPYWFGFTPEGIDPRRNGLIGADGQPNEWFAYAKKANRQIEAVDEMLMKASHEGVIVSGKLITYMEHMECILSENVFRELVQVETEEAGAFIGCFDCEGSTMLYVVNGDMYCEQKIKLQFFDKCDCKLISDRGTQQIETNRMDVSPRAGEAILVLIESKCSV